MRILRITLEEPSPKDTYYRAERVITMRELENFNSLQVGAGSLSTFSAAKHLGAMLKVIIEDLEKSLNQEIEGIKITEILQGTPGRALVKLRMK